MVKFIFLTIIALPLLAAWGDNGPQYAQKKYSFEDAIHHDKRLKCKELAAAGSNVPEIFEVSIGNSKKVELVFETFQAKDIFVVEYEGATIFDSGCIGTNGYMKKILNTKGFSDTLTIKVLPNCRGNEPTTRWEFYIICK